MKIPDEEIVSKIQAGDKESFSVIVDRYEKPLVYYALRMGGNHEVAEDVVQESFLKTYRDIQSFDTNRKFSSWIYRIVHNEAINAFRKVKASVDLADIPEIPDERSLAKEIEQKIDSKKHKEILSRALQKIPSKYKEVLDLRFFEEKEYEEISEILHIPVNTVGTLIRRGKERLKQELNVIKKEDL